MGWFDKLLFGVDLDAEAKRTDDLRAWEGRLDSAPRMSEVWTPDDWLAHQTQVEAEEAGGLIPSTYDAQIRAAAAEGAREGLAAEGQFTRDVINKTAGTVIPETVKAMLGFLPWWLWLAIAAYFAQRAGLLATAGAWGLKQGVKLWNKT